MADVVRFVSKIEEVVYTVGPDSLRRALLKWLCDEHGAAFNQTTMLRFCDGDSVTVTTKFPVASVDRSGRARSEGRERGARRRAGRRPNSPCSLDKEESR
jgi:hypothetical protein